ncbi:thiol-disulfide isomerase [uncultured Paludibaculum sp.]|uniref:thiol-disulfide isomerase n=1 Tax=uncultured Paludibaculum sp. TaxID=1765020 RepID=UPI002AAAB44B|nr:thiol-disulfide isomerase [uncultured Paludibaculum sp.]
MPLLTYQEARPWAKAIRQAVVLKKMPPWFAAAGGPFHNNPSLTTKEIETIEAWVEAGAPRGAGKDAPKPVRWQEGWNIPSPDLVVTAPKPFPVPASGAVDYQFLILPLRTLEDHWVTAAEIRPGARSAVHHIVAYIRDPDSPWLKDAPRNQAFRAEGVTTSDILAIYTPGQAPFVAPEGMAKKLRAGAELVLQFHYTPNGRAEMDQTSVGLVFTGKAPAKRVLTLQMGNAEFHIPPGDPNYRVTVGGTLPNDALLLSMFPHMHLRGKAFEYDLTAEGGRDETLLRVAPYSFQWQLNYILEQPRLLPKGTHLRWTAWFDNSASNPSNPDPAKDVSYGEQSWDEMMIGFFDVAVDPKLDKSAFFVR